MIVVAIGIAFGALVTTALILALLVAAWPAKGTDHESTEFDEMLASLEAISKELGLDKRPWLCHPRYMPFGRNEWLELANPEMFSAYLRSNDAKRDGWELQ